MNAEEYIDSELWANFKEGDKNAFKSIYFKYYRLLYNYGMKISSDSKLTEDCIQDLFLKLWKNRSSLGEIKALKAYLYTAYARILVELIKKETRTFNGSDLHSDTRDKTIEEVLSGDQDTIEQRQTLQKAMGHLSKRQQEVIYMLFYKGLSYNEIMQVIPVKYQTVRNCLHEALKVLRKHLTTN